MLGFCGIGALGRVLRLSAGFLQLVLGGLARFFYFLNSLLRGIALFLGGTKFFFCFLGSSSSGSSGFFRLLEVILRGGILLGGLIEFRLAILDFNLRRSHIPFGFLHAQRGARGVGHGHLARSGNRLRLRGAGRNKCNGYPSGESGSDDAVSLGPHRYPFKEYTSR